MISMFHLNSCYSGPLSNTSTQYSLFLLVFCSMHNIIQELRGNVRVFARIRPFLPSDGGKTGDVEGTIPSICPEGELQLTVAKPNDPSQRHRFQFDRVFAPSAGQEAVFDEVSEFVQSSLDGYQVCLFSYGQVSW